MNIVEPKKSRKRAQKKPVDIVPEETAGVEILVDEEVATVATVAEQNPCPSKVPKKRGRKPKGGKIVPNTLLLETNKGHEPNIIMHLKCGEADLVQNNFIYSTTYDPTVETFQFETNIGYSVIDYGVKDKNIKNA